MTDNLSPVSKLSISFQSLSPFIEDSSASHAFPAPTSSDDGIFKRPTGRPTKRVNTVKPGTTQPHEEGIDKENCMPTNASVALAIKDGGKVKRRNSVKRKASERSPFHRPLTQSAIGIATRAQTEPIDVRVTSEPSEDEGGSSPYKAPPVIKQRRASTASSPPRASYDDMPVSARTTPKKNELHVAATNHPVRQRRMTHSEGDLPKFHICKLPLTNISSDLNCVTSDTVASLINREKYYQFYDEVHIIDCRFGYEYEGGHIKGAKNLMTNQEVERMFMNVISPLKERICLIFHCEFSSHRGPTLCRFLRSWDRTMHVNCYPDLYYPELYVLQGGYKAFYESHPELCEPREYIPMTDGRFAEQMKTGLLSTKHQMKKGLGGGGGVSRSRSWSMSVLAHPLDPSSIMSQSQPDLTIFTRKQEFEFQKNEKEEEEEEEEEELALDAPSNNTTQPLSLERRKKLQEEVLSSSPKRSLSCSRDSVRTRVPPICFDKLKDRESLRASVGAVPTTYNEPVRVRKLQLDAVGGGSLRGVRRGGSAIDLSSSTLHNKKNKNSQTLNKAAILQSNGIRSSRLPRRTTHDLLADFDISNNSHDEKTKATTKSTCAFEDEDEDAFLNL